MADVFVKEGKALMQDPGGEWTWMPLNEAKRALSSGYKPGNEQDFAAWQESQEFDRPYSAAAAGLARGLTLGLSDVALTGFGLTEPETLRKLKEYNPAASFAGDVAGLLVPYGGLAKVGGMAAKAGVKAAGVLGKTAPGLTSRLTQAAVEGGAVGAGYTASDIALAEGELSAGDIATHLAKGAATGAAAFGALTVGGAALRGIGALGKRKVEQMHVVRLTRQRADILKEKAALEASPQAQRLTTLKGEIGNLEAEAAKIRPDDLAARIAEAKAAHKEAVMEIRGLGLDELAKRRESAWTYWQGTKEKAVASTERFARGSYETAQREFMTAKTALDGLKRSAAETEATAVRLEAQLSGMQQLQRTVQQQLKKRTKEAASLEKDLTRQFGALDKKLGEVSVKMKSGVGRVVQDLASYVASRKVAGFAMGGLGALGGGMGAATAGFGWYLGPALSRVIRREVFPKIGIAKTATKVAIAKKAAGIALKQAYPAAVTGAIRASLDSGELLEYLDAVVPEELEQQMRDVAPLEIPGEILEETISEVTGALTLLKEKAPRTPDGRIPGKNDPPPSPAAMARFARYVEHIADSRAFGRDAIKQVMTDEAIEVWERIRPAALSSYRQELEGAIAQAIQQGRRLSPREVQQYELQLRKRLSRRPPGTAAMLQQLYAQAEQQEAPPQGQRRVDLASGTRTEQQRLRKA